MNVSLCKEEGKAIIKDQVRKTWQEYWDIQHTGRHLYNIQKQVCTEEEEEKKRKRNGLKTTVQKR